MVGSGQGFLRIGTLIVAAWLLAALGAGAALAQCLPLVQADPRVIPAACRRRATCASPISAIPAF